MSIQLRIYLNFAGIFAFALFFLIVGAFIHWQEEYIIHINKLLSMTLAELSELRVYDSYNN
jgi:hypothetical protein